MKGLRRILLLLGVIAVLAAHALWAQSRPAERVCPTCKRATEKDWNYCPYDGTALFVSPRSPNDDDPKTVLLEFFKAYSEGDAKGIAERLDVEGIVASVIRRGLEEIRAQGVKSVLRSDFVDRAARAITPVILSVMTSEEMRKSYPLPEELVHKKTIHSLYRLETVAGAARLIPLGELGSPVVLKRRNERWMIAEFPVLPD